MRRSTLPAILLIAGAVVACSEGGTDATSPDQPSFGKGGGTTDNAVTATIADTDTAIAPALQLRSDGLGAYTNSNTLTSVIQGIGAWVLDSYNPRNSTRTVNLDFGQPIAGSGPNGGDPVAVPSAAYKVRIISKCNLLGTSFLTLAPGASMPCPLHVAFDYAGSSYAVQMNPGASSADPTGNAPETDYATITCVVPSSGAGPCTQWTVTPSGTYADGGGATRYRNVAKLFKYVTVRGSNTPVSQGDFYYSFSIRVTNP